MKLFFKIYLLWSLFFLTTNVFGAEKPNLRFSKIGLNDGFAGQTFYIAFKDSSNLMWFGGDNGLYCWDGYRMKHYMHNPDDSTSLSSTRVNLICQLDDYHIAVATINGVNIFDKRTEQFATLDFSKDAITLNLLTDANNVLWMGTNKGIFSYDIKTGKHRNFNTTVSNKNDFFPGDYVISLLYHNGTITAGTYDHISFFDASEDKFINYPMPIKCGIVICLIESREYPGKYWVGTDKMLFLWDKSTSRVDFEMYNNPIKNFTYDSNNNLWIGTDNGLFCKPQDSSAITKPYHSSQYNQYYHDVNDSHSLPSNIVWNTYVDNENNLWVSTTNGIGISSLQQKVVQYPIKDIVADNSGMQFFFVTTNNDDVILAGTGGVIIKNNKSRKSTWLHTEAPERNRVTHNRTRFIHADSKGIYWIASDLGLNSYNTATNTTRSYNIVEPTNRYKSAWMYHIAEKDGLFYLSTYDGGVFVVRKSDLLASNPGEQVTSIRHYSSTSDIQPIKSNIISSVQFDDSNLYFTTYSDGIFKVPNDQSKPVERLSSQSGNLSSNFIVSMLPLSDNRFAVAYSRCVDILGPSGTKKKIIETTSPINAIKSISENLICVNTYGEIFIVDILTGDYKTITTHNLGIAPIQSIFYDKFSQLLYCGSIDNYGTIDLHNLEPDPQSTKPTIINLLLNDQVVNPSTEYNGRVVLDKPLYMKNVIELSSDQNSFSLEFSSLRFSPMSSQRFMYRLRGLSDVWVATNGNNKVTFLHLPPGEYLFEIALQDRNEVDPASINTLRIIIHPPFYLSTLAFVFYGTLLSGFILLLIIYIKRRQEQRLESLERKKSLRFSQMKVDFLTNTSHELKTPLSLIMGRLSSMIVNEKNPDKRQKLLSIHNSAEQIKNLTLKNLKHNYENHGLELELELKLKSIEIVAFIDSICNSFTDKFNEKTIHFTLNKPSETIYAMLDVSQFWSVIENLLSNAIKFTPSNGSISVTIRRNETLKEVSISVSDTGCGIDPSKQPYIFDRFYKASFDSEGHGLGLAIARDIVTAHSGKLNVISTVNVGSEFIITLPMLDPVMRPQLVTSVKNVDRSPILIVEDNAEMLDFIAEGLSENFNCYKAHNGADGFKLALEHRPVLIITDLVMENMSGIELVEKIRQNIFIASTPIIVLTARSDKASEVDSFSKGADAFISKPFDINDLTIRIWQLIKKSELQNEKIRQQALATVEQANVVSLDDKFIEMLTKVIENRISDNDLSLATLSVDCALSEKQIYRRIKQLTGLTPTEYIRQIRLNRAAMLLKQGGFSVSEVLFMVGFSNPSYFTKCFKVQFHVTPSDYLEAYKEKK